MSKIEELIKEKCPNGVEYKKITDVSEFVQGFAFENNKFTENGEGIVKTTNIQNGEISETSMSYFNPNNYNQNFDKYKIETNRIVIGMSGTIKVARNKSANVYYLNQRVGMFLPFKTIDNDYLYHVLYNSIDKMFDLTTGSAVKNLSSKDINNFLIPVPPLEVQVEIAKILDKFSELEAELEAELENRKIQYEFWRGKLLNGRKKLHVSLGSLCKIITKGTTPKKYVDVGINFIKTEAFAGDYVDKAKLSFVDEKTHSVFLKRSILEKNDILFTIAGATIGKMTIVTNDLLPANTNQALAIIRLNDDINLNYIKHILKSNYMKDYIKLCVKGSAQPNLNLQQLNNFEFPLPSLEEQERIVNILEKFDKLVNDMSEGLPAEIELRKKQYEYYRNKLLAFKELNVNE